MAHNNEAYEKENTDNLKPKVTNNNEIAPNTEASTVAEQYATITKSHCSCYQTYRNGLQVIIKKIDRFFEILTTNIIKYPYCWIILCFALTFVCGLGFLRFQLETKAETLYYPVGTESEDILEKTKIYFRNTKNTRFTNAILIPKAGRNLLSPVCIKEGKKVIRTVLSIPKFQDFCLKKKYYVYSFHQYDYSHNCSLINPYEIIKNVSTASDDIARALLNVTLLMSNGKIARENVVEMFGSNNRTRDVISSVAAMKVHLYMRKQKQGKDNLKLEKDIIDTLQQIRTKFKCLSIEVLATRSIDDSINESVEADIPFLSLAFFMITTFCLVVMGKINNPIRGHSLLAVGGITCTGLGIFAGMGFAMAVGTPYVNIVGIVPFLVLSIGVDDMFIIVDEFNRANDEDDPDTKVIKCMKKVGSTITMTTLTDIAAFVISISSSFIAIRYLCIYAFITLLFDFFMQVTLFVVFLSFDAKRIQAKKRDFLPCWKAEDTNTCFRTEKSKANNLVHQIALVLVTWPSKCVILILSAVFVGGGIFGCLNVSHQISPETFVIDTSHVLTYLNESRKYFDQSILVNAVKLGQANYADTLIQENIFEAPRAAFSTNYYQKFYSSWLEQYLTWAKKSKVNTNGKNFTLGLKKYLKIPKHSHFTPDVVFDKKGEIEASQIHLFMKPSGETEYEKNAFLAIRQEFKKRDLGLSAISEQFLQFEQYAATTTEVIRNACLAAAAVLVTTLPFCIHPAIILLLMASFVFLLVEVIAMMYFWDVAVHSISMINLVISIGFAVDYSAHVAHAFVLSKESTGNERVVDALSSVGLSVLKGGLSTFLGIVVVRFASSKLFSIFFRMFFSIIVFGLFNGLLLLPVLFSLLPITS